MNTQNGYKLHAEKPAWLGGSDTYRHTFGTIGETITLWDQTGRAVNGTITAFSGTDPCWGENEDDRENMYMVVKVPVSRRTHPKDRPAFRDLATLVKKYVAAQNMPAYFEQYGTFQDFVIMFLYSAGWSVKSVPVPALVRCGSRGCTECDPTLYAKFKDEHGITRFAPLEWLTDAAEEGLEQWAANNIIKGLKINASV